MYGYIFRLGGKTNNSCPLQFYVDGTGGNYFLATGTANMWDGNWHHVEVVIDAKPFGLPAVHFYVDGVPDTTTVSGNWTNENLIINDDQWIGRGPQATKEWGGLIDNVKFVAVPEPGTLLLLLGGGLFGLLACVWKRR